ncbi:MAG: hypothetical protein ACHQ17_01055 [Polyangia bacterium]
MKKGCTACGKQIPSVALDCVFCGAKQPVEASAELATVHATDPTMSFRLADLEGASPESAAAESAPVSTESPKSTEPGKENGVNGAAQMPSQARLTAAMPIAAIASAVAEAQVAPAVMKETPVAPSATEPATVDEKPRAAVRPSVPGFERPFAGLSRTVMGVGGVVLLALFFLPWHGVSSWQLLQTLGGADFVRQLFYLTGGIVLIATAALPLPFVFRATVGTVVAALPVVLGAGGLLEGWRGVVAALAIIGLPATHLLRSQAKSSTAARALVMLAVGAVAVLYLVPIAQVVPIVGVVKMIFSGELGPAVMGVFILIPLVFAALSLLGLLGRDLTDVGILLSVLILLWAPVVVALRGLLMEDGTQLYIALALLWASAISGLSLAQLLALAA